MKNVNERDANSVANGLAEYLSLSLGNAQILLQVYGIDGISVNEIVSALVKFSVNFIAICAPDGQQAELLFLFGDRFREVATDLVETYSNDE